MDADLPAPESAGVSVAIQSWSCVPATTRTAAAMLAAIHNGVRERAGGPGSFSSGAAGTPAVLGAVGCGEGCRATGSVVLTAAGSPIDGLC